MANDYFDSGDYTELSKGARARSSGLNAILDAIVAGFAKLPGLSKLREERITYAADTGAADVYVVTLDNAPSSYAAGLTIKMKVANTNTGASTVNVNSLGATAITRSDGSALTAGDLTAGRIVLLIHDGTQFQLLSADAVAAASSASSAASSASDAEAAQTAAESALDSFDDRYLGAKSSDPSVDNDGATLQTGALYWNTTSSKMRVYTGTAWTDFNNYVVETDDGAGAGPSRIVERISASPAASDLLGQDLFRGRNDADEAVDFARLRAMISDATDGAEDGALLLGVMVGGSLTDLVQVGPGALVALSAALSAQSLYTTEGTFTVSSAGTTTEVIDGLDGASIYLVSYVCFGTNMQTLLLGVVVTGGVDTIVQVETLRSYDFNLGSIQLQTKGNATPATFNSGNGNAFQFVCTGDGAADRTATYRLLKLI